MMFWRIPLSSGWDSSEPPSWPAPSLPKPSFGPKTTPDTIQQSHVIHKISITLSRFSLSLLRYLLLNFPSVFIGVNPWLNSFPLFAKFPVRFTLPAGVIRVR